MTGTTRQDDHTQYEQAGESGMLEFSVFGEIHVQDGDRHLGPRDLGGIKSKQILEILLLNRGHTVSKDSLADFLWGDSLPTDYFGALESHVSVLRGRLQPGTKVRQSVIRTEPGGYRFVAEQATVDLDRFDALVADAGRARAPRSRQLLTAALELVKGDVLEDEPDAEWSCALRERYQARCVEVCVAAAEAALRAGQADAALRLADQALAIDHVAEAAYRTAMVAAYQLGRYDGALDTFERCKAVLAAELGVEPLEETVALYEAVSRRDPRLSHPSAAGGLRLGAGRGKAEQFLGRSEELARVVGHVQTAVTGRLSVLVVQGEAGVGKSALVDAALTRVNGTPVARTACSGLDRDFPCLAVVASLQKLFDGEDGERPTPLDDVLLAASVSAASGKTLPPPWALDSMAAIVREHAPFVLVVDGLEGADDMSLAVLEHLRVACADAPVALIGVTRDHGATAGATSLLEGAARLELGPLTPGDLETSNIVELHAHTGGHPLYVSAMLQAGGSAGDSVPKPVGELVAARSRAFGPREHRVLRAAAVLSEPFTAATVAHLLDDDAGEVAEVLDKLCAHRVLWSTEGRFSFRHRVVRDSLYQMLSPARRRLLTSRLGSPHTAGQRRLEAA